MFIVSVKTDRKQFWTVFACSAMLVVALLTAVLAPSPKAANASARVANSDDRLAYLRACGVTADANSEEVREIRLPDEPDDTIAQYNAQQEQGEWTLAPYYGKRVRLYTYAAETAKGTAIVHLYVYRDRVVAGDITQGETVQVLPKP